MSRFSASWQAREFNFVVLFTHDFFIFRANPSLCRVNGSFEKFFALHVSQKFCSNFQTNVKNVFLDFVEIS